MPEDEWSRLYEKYGAKSRQKYTKIILIISIAAVGIVAYFLFSYFGKPVMTGSIKENLQLASASEGEYRIQTNLPEDRCYWIKPGYEERYYIDIIEYESTDKNCVGTIVNESRIETKQPINIVGKDCICGQKICNFKNELKEKSAFLDIKGC